MVYPLLFLLWVNIHGLFSIGLLFVGTVTIGEIIDRYFKTKNHLSGKSVSLLILSVCGSFAASLVNPFGPGYPAGIVKNFFMKSSSLHNYDVFENIGLSQFLHLSNYSITYKITNTAWLMIVMFAAFLWIIATVYRRYRVINSGILLVNLLFFTFGMTMIRISAYYPILWLASMFYFSMHREIKHQYLLPPVSGMVIMLVSFIIIFGTVRYSISRDWTGIPIESVVPVREAAFVKSNRLPSPIFNDYATGAYLMWALYPEYKVFIDPRYRPYLASGLLDDYTGLLDNPIPERLNALSEKYPFRTALINHQNNSEIVRLFIHSPEWQLIYFDQVAVVFVRLDTINDILTVDESIYSENANTMKFRNCKNPLTLLSLFKIYYWTGAYDKSQELMALYERNVGRLYLYRDRQITEMKRMLSLVINRRNNCFKINFRNYT